MSNIILLLNCEKDSVVDVEKLFASNKEIVLKESLENVTIYDWEIDNKYYRANFELIFPKKGAVYEKQVEFVILFYDTLKNNCISELNEWLDGIAKYKAKGKMLLCNSFENTSETMDIYNWTIENDVFYVRLQEKLSDSTNGFDWLKETLETHPWPCVFLKDRKEAIKEEDIKEDADKEEAAKKETVGNKPTIDKEDADEILQMLKLAEKMSIARKAAESERIDSRRRQRAEELVKVFWSSVDGDHDELDSDDDED